MCGSHTQSEEEVLFPAVDHRTGKVVPGRGGYRTEKLSREHEEESRHLATLREAVHEALLECHVYAREEATREQRLAHQNLMRQLSDASDAALLDIANHLLAEEAEVSEGRWREVGEGNAMGPKRAVRSSMHVWRLLCQLLGWFCFEEVRMDVVAMVLGIRPLATCV